MAFNENHHLNKTSFVLFEYPHCSIAHITLKANCIFLEIDYS